MRRIIIIAGTLLFVIATGWSLGGCYGINAIAGSKDLETREYTFTDFNRVEVLAPFQVEIRYSNIYQVNITANENLFDYIEVVKSGETLRIRLKPFLSFRNTTFQITIAMPDLRALELSGASSGNLAAFQSNHPVAFIVNGASKLNIVSVQAPLVTMEITGASRATGFVKTDDADFEVSGASTLELNGSADSAKLEASGASSLRLRDFYILHASALISGASNGDITVNGRLDVNVSGASRLTFRGNPTLGNVEVSGASNLNRQ